MTNVQRFVVVVAVAAAIVLSIALWSEENSYAVATAWRHLIGDPGQTCFDYVRSELKDPFSARLAGYERDESYKDVVVITYRAKNSFGAYDKDEAVCVVEGRAINQERTETQRKLRKINALLEQLQK